MYIRNSIALAAFLFSAFATAILAQTENTTEYNRMQKLVRSAPAAYMAGDTANAAAMANELLQLAPKFDTDWNYGNAMHTGHLLLGRIALDAGDIKAAKSRLLASVAEAILPYGLMAKHPGEPRGTAKGSPQMDSFGPDMTLASQLLDKGEAETVLKYFDLCSKFWSVDNGSLAKWRKQIAAGEKPDFGPNLVYFFSK